ncbi:NHLP leader peptide domain protein [Thiorhodovibrio winogradskyi]|uniref:NHLP leader peptide domain protein n=1 Tax=Thiorhodovibrio winogradskyi TaxID=77007 RepID=A0ABZ0S8P4_9GAMM|nr:NHLP leader peptide family RiPP precursor [Thiorhodovibrio winogradskyi]
MSDTAQIENPRRKLQALITKRAWEDEDFRRQFVATPEACFAEIGVELPPGFKVRVHEEDQDHLHFVIPPRPKRDLDALTDEELERIAGGAGGTNEWDVLNKIVDKVFKIVDDGIGGWGKG